MRRLITALLLFLHLVPPGWGQSKGVVKMLASFYGERESGKRMANGNPFNPDNLTAAHRTLKFGTRLRVWLGAKNVCVVVTDRGPYINGRHLDLSEAAARKLGMIDRGIAWVKVVIEDPVCRIRRGIEHVPAVDSSRPNRP